MKTRLISTIVVTAMILSNMTQATVAIVNPSFELDTPDSFITPTGWTLEDSVDFGEGIDTDFVTDGNQNFRFWSFVEQGCQAGSYESLHQNVDLTGITEILFDVRLSAHYYGAPSVFQDYKAVFLVDGISYWSQQVDGTYMDQSINVAALSGVHTITLSQVCIQNETFDPSCWSEWDNLRTIPEPTTMLLLGLGGLLLRKRKSFM